MDSLTFTINFKDINDTDEPQQVVDDLKLLFRFLMNANPNYYLVGNMLNEQLDKQVEQHKEEEETLTPIGKMYKKLDELCPYVMSAMQDEELKNLYAELRNQIGDAMGPVSYAAYKLAQKLSKQNCSVNWVWDFVKYYEDNWEF